MSLTLQVNRSENVTIVSCTGRIVFGQETTNVCRTVRDILPENSRILLNLRGCDHIDSGGLGALVGLVLSARRLGGDVKLCCAMPRVRELLRTTRLDTVIAVFNDEQSGVAAFRPTTAAA